MNEKEQAILNAATSLFSKYGYHAVGIDSIIAESKVAKMTFYKHFKSKDLLIERVLHERYIILKQDILDFIQDRSTALAKLRAIFDWHKIWFESSDFHGCMFIKAMGEYPESNSNMRTAARSYKEWLNSLIGELVEAILGKKQHDLPPLILAILDGLTINCSLFPETIEERVKQSWTQVHNLIKARKIPKALT